ncbi:MAG TPA: GYF domain-containing protein [Opitutaceae bacterium]|nr:GYF domain-containing protein [Opitutaceae bacterium]
MYTIIGGDGKEYGPVTADQVRAWIAGGRANQETKIKVVGTDEWKRIADVPELAGAGAEGAVPPLAAAAVGGSAPKLEIISCYERSWELLKANFWPLVGVSFLIMVISSVIGRVILFPFGFITSLFLAGVLTGGWYYYFLLKIRGQTATVGDAFAGFTRAFITLVATWLLISIFVALGFCFLILPGIYLAVAYQFTYILATDKRLGIWDSMETSRRVITGQWWRFLGLLLLGIPFFILGLAALGVGIFVAMPLIVGAVAYAYEDLCNPKQ